MVTKRYIVKNENLDKMRREIESLDLIISMKCRNIRNNNSETQVTVHGDYLDIMEVDIIMKEIPHRYKYQTKT